MNGILDTIFEKDLLLAVGPFRDSRGLLCPVRLVLLYERRLGDDILAKALF